MPFTDGRSPLWCHTRMSHVAVCIYHHQDEMRPTFRSLSHLQSVAHGRYYRYETPQVIVWPAAQVETRTVKHREVGPQVDHVGCGRWTRLLKLRRGDWGNLQMPRHDPCTI